ncbi:TLC domain-containing protein 4-B-like isoform X2 [Crassostrea virginica]|uniref:Transmembrane protein 56-B-like isoform X2 n=1 Tax=Crassostrea virginica TaxID=6565 RepID=A0A8B8CW00_CRAVI|nr:transmembrane protein 56-B-like isoform X2 [Crassostrea virginica]
MSSAQIMEFDSRVNSSVHAVVVSSMCVYAFLYEEELKSNPIWCNSPIVRIECAVVIGYMLADAVVMAIYYKQIGEVFFLFHHAASVYAYYYVVVYGVMTSFANYRLLAELSTPFVNNRFFFDMLGIKKTDPLGFTNGILMTLSFFVVRIFVLPFYWMKVYEVYGTEAFVNSGHVRMVLVVTCVVLDVINLFWFYKMLKGVHKVLKVNFDKNYNETAKKIQ